MINNVLYLMSDQELNRKSVLDRVKRRELTQIKAAKLLGLSDRWVRFLLSDYKERGPEALISAKRGKISNRAKPKEFKDMVLSIVKEKYSDFGPTFAAEKLEELDNIIIHHETLRLWMNKDGIRNCKKRKSTKKHQSRERRDCFGELVQIDGSHHDWFEGRAPECCLLVFVDDATSSLLYCRFEEAETTQGYFRSVKDSIDTFGKPLCYYSDKHSVFRVNQESATQGVTQFQRAMKELDIKLICANSPQAKGKVERANKILQDRLIKQLRLKGINSIADANKYLPEFVAEYNEKFAKPPKSNQDIHREVTESKEKLNYILSVRETKKLSKNLECSFYNKIYQIITKTASRRLRHAEVNFAQDTNRNIEIWYNNKKLEYKILQKEQRTEVKDRKTLNIQFKTNKFHKPAENHPWRKYKIKNKQLTVSLHKEEVSNLQKTGSF